MKILTRTFIWWVNFIYCNCYYNLSYLNIPLNLQNFNLNKHRSYRNLAAAELIAKQQKHFMKCLPKDQAFPVFNFHPNPPKIESCDRSAQKYS